MKRAERKLIREAVEIAIARSGGTISNRALMDTYGINYRQLQIIKHLMAGKRLPGFVSTHTRAEEDERRRLQRPCGTHAAFVRHKKHGEQPCTECVEAERTYQRERKRYARAAA